MPEEQVSTAEQLQAAGDAIRRHSEAFELWRPYHKLTVADMISNFIEQERDYRKDKASRRGVLRRKQKAMHDPLDIILRVLWDFRQRGMRVAEETIRRYLADPDYIYPGQKLEEEGRLPVLMVAYRLDIIIPLMQWVKNPENHTQELRNGENEAGQALLELLPAAAKYYSKAIRGTRRPLLDAYWIDYAMKMPFIRVITKDREVATQAFRLQVQEIRVSGEQVQCYSKDPGRITASADGLFFLFDGMERGSFFKRADMDRKHQADVSTWQFRLPGGIPEGEAWLVVYPAADHVLWRQLAPSYCSIRGKATEREWEAAILPDREALEQCVKIRYEQNKVGDWFILGPR